MISGLSFPPDLPSFVPDGTRAVDGTFRPVVFGNRLRTALLTRIRRRRLGVIIPIQPDEERSEQEDEEKEKLSHAHLAAAIEPIYCPCQSNFRLYSGLSHIVPRSSNRPD